MTVDTAALRAAHEASTQGEWFVWEDDLYIKVDSQAAGNVCNTGRSTWPMAAENAAFIVAAHTHVPALLAEVEKLRAENAELQKNLEMSKFALAQFGLQIYNPSDADTP